MPHAPERFLTPELLAYFVPDEGSLPGAEHPAVDHNLKKLHGIEFIDQMREESFGGNAGFEFINASEKVSCVAVNGYAEPESGRIVTFGNEQYLDRRVVEANSHIRFKVGMSKKTFQMMIVGFYASSCLGSEGRAVLGGTIEAYNFDSEMLAKQEKERLRELYGEIGLQALTGDEPEMSPVRRYRANRLTRLLKR